MSVSWTMNWYAFQIQEQCSFVNENDDIYIYRIVNENILEKQKIRGKEKNYDVIVPKQQEQRKLEKNLYQRTKRRKEKYEIINATVYELNDLTYLIV